jgi:hypothetical protein
VHSSVQHSAGCSREAMAVGRGEQRTGREHAHRETQQRASEGSAHTRGERGARVPHVPALFTLSVKEMLG